MMGKDAAGSINEVNYRRDHTFACIVGSHLQQLHHHIGIITPDKIPVPIYRPEGWTTWLARAHVNVRNLLRDQIQRLELVFNPGRRVEDKTPIDANEPIAPNIIGRE